VGKKVKIRFIQFGLGAIGLEFVKAALKKEWLELAGVVDIDKEKIGKDIGEFIGINECGSIIGDDADKILSQTNADIAIVTTASGLRDVYPLLEKIIENKVNIVSTSEELFYPYTKNKELAEKIDKKAKENNVKVLGTGVNPGFVMDALAVVLSSICNDVKKIKIRRIVDLSTRRMQLQRKIGLGMEIKDFKEKVKENSIGHIGLYESLEFVADVCRFNLDSIEEYIEPIDSDKELKTDYFEIRQGKVKGMKHLCKGIKNNEEVIRLELDMVVGEKPVDSVIIEGEPDVNMEINNGVSGDIATVAALINIIPKVINAKSGLLTMKELTLPFFER